MGSQGWRCHPKENAQVPNYGVLVHYPAVNQLPVRQGPPFIYFSRGLGGGGPFLTDCQNQRQGASWRAWVLWRALL